MIKEKKLFIWLDHSIAHLMELTINSIETKTIELKFSNQDEEYRTRKSEDFLHNKEKQQLLEFYTKLWESIKLYEEVILFGPTTAKNELANLLKDDHHFEKIKVVVKHADKMTENQMHNFIEDYFKYD